MQDSRGYCEVLIPVHKRASSLCLMGGVLLEVLGVLVIGVGLWSASDKLVELGGGALCTTGLLPFKSYYDQTQKLMMLQGVKAGLLSGALLPATADDLIQKILKG